MRKFKPDAVPKKALSRILKAARWAPSAGNCQPWKLVLVTNVERKGKIAEICTVFSKEAWKSFSPERAQYLAARGGTWDKSYMKNVPILLVVCYGIIEKMRDELVLGSVWTAIENMLLAATDNGLGSCVYTFYSSEEENKIKQALCVPRGFRIACIVQLGYPLDQPLPPLRKKLREIVAYEHF